MVARNVMSAVLNCRLIIMPCLGLFLWFMFLPRAAFSDCPIGPSPYRWCPPDHVLNIRVYFGTGLRDQPIIRTRIIVELENWSQAFLAHDIDLRLVFQADPEFDPPNGFVPGDSGIPEVLFTYECICNFQPDSTSCDPTYEYTACTQPVALCSGGTGATPSSQCGAHTGFNATAGNEYAAIKGACVTINSAAPWHATDMSTVIRHEIGHVLGLGDMNQESLDDPDATCGGELMFGANCDERLIDNHAIATAACLYGQVDWLGDPLPPIASVYGIATGVATDDATGMTVLVLGGTCNRTRAYCTSSTGRTLPAARTDLTYELAVAEVGSPFAVFANLTDPDWILGEYRHTFTTSYVAAVFRMRVYDSGSLVDACYTGIPIAVGSNATEVPEIEAPLLSLEVFGSPSGTGRVYVEYLPAAGAETVVDILDLRGRLVRSLVTETSDGRRRRIEWDGRDDHGGSVPAGIYLIRMQGAGISRSARAVLLR